MLDDSLLLIIPVSRFDSVGLVSGADVAAGRKTTFLITAFYCVLLACPEIPRSVREKINGQKRVKNG
jgi:hypothetical protein